MFKVDDIPIFVISMVERTPERTKRAREHLDSHKLNYHIYPAFDGRKIGIANPDNPWLRDHGEDFWRPPYGNGTNEPFFVGPGILALATTWVSICKAAMALNIPEILVLEDDVVLTDGFKDKFELFYSELPKPYGLAYLGRCCDQGHIKQQRTPHVCYTKTLCTHAVLVDQLAMKKIDQKFKLHAPIDIFFQLEIFDDCPHGGLVPTAEPELATQLTLVGGMPTSL